MPLSPAELAAMPRTTPTAQAEAAYQSGRSRQRTAGALPRPRDIFRKADARLLHDLAKRAHQDRLDAETSGEAAAEVARILSADVDGRFPAADMAVLQRHGCAGDFSEILVDCRDFSVARFRPVLDPPRPLPMGGWRFTAAGPGTAAVPRVPDELLPYFDRLATLRDERLALPRIDAWPGFYLKNQGVGRYPRWEEIEHQFPLFGQWMAAQRRAAA